MKHEVKKLNNFVYTDSFMQINYLRGFKYVDKAGEIINIFFKNEKEPPYQMDSRELLIRSGQEDTQVYKVAVDNIWARETKPQNLGSFLDDFRRISANILQILEVNEITRVGWRNYFVYEVESDAERNRILSKFLPLENTEFLEINFKKEIYNFSCKISLRSAIKNDTSKKSAIIFDVDCYQNFKEATDSIKAFEAFKQIKDILHSNDMMAFFNSVLS